MTPQPPSHADLLRWSEALSGIARRRKDGGEVVWDRATPLLEGRGGTTQA